MECLIIIDVDMVMGWHIYCGNAPLEMKAWYSLLSIVEISVLTAFPVFS